MCDCASLPARWWANDDSDRQAGSIRDWKRSSQIDYGWAVLWKCPFCGQFWEGIVVPGGYGESTDCVAKFYGEEHSWFVRRNADHDRFVREGRVLKKVEQTAMEYERAGYEVEYSSVRDPWGGQVEWKYTLFCRKKGLLGGQKERLDFVLTADGDVHVHAKGL